MARFGPMVWTGNGLEIYASPQPPTKKKGRVKVWIRIQGATGTALRVYQCLSYARCVDLCFEHDVRLRPRKRRRSGP
jgi:hypothetical protein